MNLQNYILLPRILESVLFLALLIVMNNRYYRIKLRNRPLLQRLFFFGFLGWFIYIFLDIFIYSFADLSFTITDSFPQRGYSLEFPSLLIANILRDIAFFFVQIEIWAFFFIPFAINYGKIRTIQLLTKKWLIFGIIILTLFFTWNDVIVVDVVDGNFLITENWNGISGISLILMIILYLIASILLRIIVNHSIDDVEQKIQRQKIHLLSIGIFLMGLGYILAIFFNVLTLWIDIVNFKLYFIFGSYCVHFFWILSPIFILYSFYIRENTHKHTHENINEKIDKNSVTTN